MPFDASSQIVASNNGVTILKPSWMSQEYWQKYEVPRVGKRYGKGGNLYGQTTSSADVLAFAKSQTEAVSGDDGDCDGCKI